MNNSLVSLMASHLNDHLKNSEREYEGGPVPYVVCRDGTIISVQVGKYHYCRPRSNQGPWTHVEVMMISDTTPVYFNWPVDDVAGYVPIESVAREILARGNAELTRNQ